MCLIILSLEIQREMFAGAKAAVGGKKEHKVVSIVKIQSSTVGGS